MGEGQLRPDTVAVHARKAGTKSVNEPEIAPIYASAVFRFESLTQVDEVWTGRQKGYVYSRMANPGVEAVERSVDLLEGGIGTVACASGMAAMNIMLEGCHRPGGRIVSASVLYGATRSLLERYASERGLGLRFVDIADLNEVGDALKDGADMLFCESISNPMMQVADLPKLAELAHEAGALLAVDNTFATPVLLRPFAHGADIVMHSCTKYMNGHDDVMAGTVTVSPGAPKAEELLAKIRRSKTLLGPVLSPFEAWLLQRGIRTLGVRMARHSSNASALAAALSKCSKVREVFYPGLEAASDPASPSSRLLKEGYGGMLSFTVKGGLKAAEKLIGSLSLATFVPSLGSFATTVSHPSSTSHRNMKAAEKKRTGITDGLIRVSVGLEDVRDIIDDFEKGLS